MIQLVQVINDKRVVWEKSVIEVFAEGVPLVKAVYAAVYVTHIPAGIESNTLGYFVVYNEHERIKDNRRTYKNNAVSFISDNGNFVKRLSKQKSYYDKNKAYRKQ